MCRICLRGHHGETLVQILAVQALAGHCQGAVAQDACPTPQVNITLKEVQVMPCIPPVFSSEGSPMHQAPCVSLYSPAGESPQGIEKSASTPQSCSTFMSAHKR